MKWTPKQIWSPDNAKWQRIAQKPQTQVWVTASQTMDTLDYASHPKYQLIQQWIGDSKENQEWFESNKTTLFADPKSITIAGFALALKPLGGIYGYKSGLESLKTTNHTKYPDWRIIINTFPWNLINKSKFIQQVLGLTLGGYLSPYGNYLDIELIGYAWSSVSVDSWYEILEFNPQNIYISNSSPNFAFWVLGCK